MFIFIWSLSSVMETNPSLTAFPAKVSLLPDSLHGYFLIQNLQRDLQYQTLPSNV